MAGEIAVLYENEAWMAPLFAALEARGLPYRRVFADDQAIDPDRRPLDALLVNKVSPSSYLRGHARSIGFARTVLAHYEAAGIPVVNGTPAYELEISKTKQVQLLGRLGLPHPRTRFANSPAGVLRAARGLRYPILVKPNVGGSGALIRGFADEAALGGAAETLDFGVDGTVLVQELLPAAGDSIVRLEILDGEPLYAIAIGIDPAQGFNLCPADICQVPGAEVPAPLGDELAGTTSSLDETIAERSVESPAQVRRDSGAAGWSNCVVELGKQQRQIERADPSKEIWAQGLALARAGQLDVCGIEYLVDARTGEHVFYDINALSNFVTDAPRIVGFDPHAVFVDYLAKRAGLGEALAV